MISVVLWVIAGLMVILHLLGGAGLTLDLIAWALLLTIAGCLLSGVGPALGPVIHRDR